MTKVSKRAIRNRDRILGGLAEADSRINVLTDGLLSKKHLADALRAWDKKSLTSLRQAERDIHRSIERIIKAQKDETK